MCRVAILSATVNETLLGFFAPGEVIIGIILVVIFCARVKVKLFGHFAPGAMKIGRHRRERYVFLPIKQAIDP